MEARVSVLIATYNSPYLEAAIESVYAQTVTPAQVIVINDGSTDDTEARLRQLTLRLPSSFISRTKENGGCASALNFGLRLVTGTHVAFLDHDDLWHPKKLERQLAGFAKHPDLGLSFTDHSLIFGRHEDSLGVKNHGPDGSPRAIEMPPDPWRPEAEAVLELLLTRPCPIPTMSTVMMPRDVLAGIGDFDEELVTGHDVKMYLDLTAQGWRIDYVPERLVEYRWHGGNLSRDGESNRHYMWQLADKFYGTHGRALSPAMRDCARKWRARAHLVTAIDAIRAGEKSRARHHVLKAAQIRPLSVRPGWLRMLGIGARPG